MIKFWYMHRIEKWCGKMAHGSLCVTRSHFLYDQPPEFFRLPFLEEKHKLFCRINKSLSQPSGFQDCISSDNNDLNEIPFTTHLGTDIFLKQNGLALIVSSTSWTLDEDFSILWEAALMYDRRVVALLNEDDSTRDEVVWKEIYDGKQFLYPRLLFIITGCCTLRQSIQKELKLFDED
ncbi:UDP-Glycosyltransferase superfamily protein [Abeliophyllum distichum]|uniref:UDP-Glycosyltransferase superfamily protein n=1 Tax=Abeliophyllum distichum TaxID=126358 RepID=A0ABD1QIT8_9LAMI